MSKHTPKPWFAVGAQVEIEDDSVPDICTCDPQVMRQSHLDWHPRTVEANARLIAAAPDLLEALEQMVGLFEPGRVYDFREVSAISSESLKIALAAIAKAKGEDNE